MNSTSIAFTSGFIFGALAVFILLCLYYILYCSLKKK